MNQKNLEIKIKKNNIDDLINYINTTKQNVENNSKSSESQTYF